MKQPISCIPAAFFNAFFEGVAPPWSGAAVATLEGVAAPDGRGGGLAPSAAGDGGTGQDLAGTVEPGAEEDDMSWLTWEALPPR